MSLKNYTKTQIDELSDIEIARLVLNDIHKRTSFSDLTAKIEEIRQTKFTQKKLLQFYTDLNSNGSFISMGKNQWALRSWFAIDSINETIHETMSRKNKKRKRHAKNTKKKVAKTSENEDEDVIDSDDEDVIESDDEDENSSDTDEKNDSLDTKNLGSNNGDKSLDVLKDKNDLDDLSDGNKD